MRHARGADCLRAMQNCSCRPCPWGLAVPGVLSPTSVPHWAAKKSKQKETQKLSRFYLLICIRTLPFLPPKPPCRQSQSG